MVIFKFGRKKRDQFWLDCHFFSFSFFVVGGFNQINKIIPLFLKADLNFQRWGQIKGFGGTKAKNGVLQW